MKNRVLPTAIVALAGAIIGSFLMMLYASTHFSGVAGPNNTPPAVSAAPLTGVSDQQRIISAVKRALPSVVTIDTVVNGVQEVPVDPFGQFYAPQRVREAASGSGFVISKNGLIVTNAHVVNGLQGNPVKTVTVIFKNGDRVTGRVYSVNPAVDVALVKVNYSKLPPPLQLGDSSRLQLGQWAIAIGEPFELKDSVSVGVVSGFNRAETAGEQQSGIGRRFSGLLQTSAPINPGNSGGPLLDMNGDVIGINQLTNEQAQNIGFAIPINLVKQAVAQLESHPGETNGPPETFMGVYYQPVTNGIRQQLNYVGSGIVIMQVVPNSPAAHAGLQSGDVVQEVDGRRIGSGTQFKSIVAKHKSGDVLHLRVWGNGQARNVNVTLGSTPAGNLNITQPQGMP